MNKYWRDISGGVCRQLQVGSGRIPAGYAERMGIDIVLRGVDELPVLAEQCHGQVCMRRGHIRICSQSTIDGQLMLIKGAWLIAWAAGRVDLLRPR